jgi:hypothetical protein
MWQVIAQRPSGLPAETQPATAMSWGRKLELHACVA